MNNLDKVNPNELILEAENEVIELGQWFWYNFDREDKKDLCYISGIGSNYVKVSSINFGRFEHVARIHDNELYLLERELDHLDIISKGIKDSRDIINTKMAQIKKITASLGVSKQDQLSDQSNKGSGLAVLSGKDDMGQYKKDLVAAKEDKLPALFEEIKTQNAIMAGWMSAELAPLKVEADSLKPLMNDIDDRIFNVSIYAGLSEEMTACQGGEPARMDAKLHVMQRKLYMDEECLLGYEDGGIDITKVNQFDKWLCKDENLNRMLPFDRCIVAMQVRRKEKDRHAVNMPESMINVSLAEFDKKTFLLIRNGEQVFRLETDIQFGDLIYPSEKKVNHNEPIMFYIRHSRDINIMTLSEFEQRKQSCMQANQRKTKWYENNSKTEWYKEDRVLDQDLHFPYEQYELFNQDSVQFDDIKKHLDEQAEKYNRIGLIIQGLLDRSPALHPHPPVKMWDPESFENFIRLIRDGSNALNYGDPVDFEAYRRSCNELISEDSILTGQKRFWLLKEGKRESDRLDNDWRNPSEYRPITFRPYGNPGPKNVSKMKWKKNKKEAVFTWFRERLNYHSDKGDIKTSVVIPVDELFNVSAYKKGDYKQFFRDPRTRQDYMQWAPMLMAAEQYIIDIEKNLEDEESFSPMPS